jgi:hypothetical protein
MPNAEPTQLGPDEFIEVVKRTPLVSIDLIVKNRTAHLPDSERTAAFFG